MKKSIIPATIIAASLASPTVAAPAVAAPQTMAVTYWGYGTTSCIGCNVSNPSGNAEYWRVKSRNDNTPN